MKTLRILPLACRDPGMKRVISLLHLLPALPTVLARPVLANIKTLIQLPRRRSVYMHERLFVPRIIFAIGLLVVGGAERPAHGKPINQNFTFDLSLGSVMGGFVDPATGQPIEEYLGIVAYPTFTPTLSPGDTYRLRVRFPNREAIQLIGGGAKQGIAVAGFRDPRSIVQARNVLFSMFGGRVAVRPAKVKAGERPYLIARVALNRNVLLEAAVSCVKSGSGGTQLLVPTYRRLSLAA